MEDEKYTNAMAFISDKLKGAKKVEEVTPKGVVLYGFGRIGRLVARELMTKTRKDNQLRLSAIVTRDLISEIVLAKRASLLMNDSVHGQFARTVSYDLEKSENY